MSTTARGQENATPTGAEVNAKAHLSDAEGNADADTTTTEEERAALSTDDLHHILSNQRRRTIIDALDDAAEPLSKGELAKCVAARETGKDPGDLKHVDRKRALVGIYQHHLPKLLDARVVAGSDREGYQLGPNADALLDVMEYHRVDENGSGGVLGLVDRLLPSV